MTGMDMQLVLMLAAVTAGLAWVVWDVIAPLVHRDDDE